MSCKLLINNIISFMVIATYCYASEDDDQYGPDYGTKWLLFLDDNGTTHFMNFSSLPEKSEGLQLGPVRFYLFTRQNIENGETLIIPTDGDRIKSKYFDYSKDIIAITHGWLSGTSNKWVIEMKNALLQAADQNLIAVDWSRLSKNPNYPWPAFSTRYVGKRFAKLLESLATTYCLHDPKIHLIGHSLGAHVMGYAGMFSTQKIHRITGLDPARPLFELPLMDKDFRLDESDANFVDIIHTCAGVFGYNDSHGDADFYPNSGKPPQPGCSGPRNAVEACSHGRAIEFFTESINSTSSFKAYPCENWEEFNAGKCKTNAALMGYPATDTRTGDFYLNTNEQPQYAKNEE